MTGLNSRKYFLQDSLFIAHTEAFYGNNRYRKIICSLAAFALVMIATSFKYFSFSGACLFLITLCLEIIFVLTVKLNASAKRLIALTCGAILDSSVSRMMHWPGAGALYLLLIVIGIFLLNLYFLPRGRAIFDDNPLLELNSGYIIINSTFSFIELFVS